MKLATITTEAQQWILGEEQVFPLDTHIEDTLTRLQKALLAQDFTGGVVTGKPVVFTTSEGTFELSQWLTEKLDRPFIQGTLAEFDEKAAKIPWEVVYHGFKGGKDEYSVESLLTVGNGFMGLRGTTPEMSISDATYPATYLASLYNTAASEVAGQTIYNEDFVNAPNLQKIFLVVDGVTVDIASNELVELTRRLDLASGLFTATALVQITPEKTIAIRTKKIASMANVHQYAIQYSFSPVDFSGEIQVVTEADGSVCNYNVERYRSLTREHLDIQQQEAHHTQALLVAKTKQSAITVRQTSRLASPELDLSNLVNTITSDQIIQSLLVEGQAGQWYTLEKIVTVEQYRPTDTIPAAAFPTSDTTDFATIYQASQEAWQTLWEKAAITIEGDLMSQKLLNLHTYHTLVSASPNGNAGLDASVTARGLHGEAYRGHIFWDELFILPFYIIHFPKTARELLMYRYRRLATAKADAQKAGYQGAMFPWQSGLDGTEQSQELHLNPISGEWKEDHSRLQRHVSLAIAYNVWNYYNNSQDETFMADYGLEMILEIAHFWKSIATWNATTQRYDISGVMGPDEFHEGYPGADKGGLTNNAYSNMMVVWLFEEVEALQKTLPAAVFQRVLAKTGLTAATLGKMAEIKNKLALEINDEGIIAQFAGYFALKDLDWGHYQEKYGNIYRMDRILNAEGRSADAYKVAKQADSLMIYYNFPKAKVDGILQDLGYQLPTDYVEQNLNYYLARTSHGSTLSRVVHAQLAAMVEDRQLAWQLYKEALYSDYRDIQGGTTAEGIHAGVMAATLFIPLTTFAGLDIRQDTLDLTPKMPTAWKSIAFRLKIRGVHFEVRVTHETITITADQDTTIRISGQPQQLVANVRKTVAY